MRDWMEIIDELLGITEKYEEVMTNEDLEKLSELRNECENIFPAYSGVILAIKFQIASIWLFEHGKHSAKR